jgi:hypothetical protein
VAILTSPKAASRKHPDFAARLKKIYGNRVMKQTAAELLAAERGER